jgi:hypothetical protein
MICYVCQRPITDEPEYDRAGEPCHDECADAGIVR